MAKDRFEVSDEFFEFFQTLLPERVNTHRIGGGRLRKSIATAALAASC